MTAKARILHLPHTYTKNKQISLIHITIEIFSQFFISFCHPYYYDMYYNKKAFLTAIY